MPIFYFDIVDGQLHEDEEGRNPPDSSHVEKELKQRLSEIVLQGENPVRALVNVRDERKDVVATATISAAINYPDTHH